MIERDGGEGCQGRRGWVRNVNQERLSMYVSHRILECDVGYTERQPLLQCMRHLFTDCDSLCDGDKLVWI